MTDYSALVPLSSRKPLTQFVVSMLLILLIAIAGLLLTLLSAWLIYGIAPGELDIWQVDQAARHIRYFKYLQALQHLSMFLLPALAIAYFMKGDAWSYLGLKNKPPITSVLLSMLFIIFIIPLNTYLSWLNADLNLPAWLGGLEEWINEKELQSARLTTILMNAAGPGALLINIVIIALIPALGEEFLYRGVLQEIFTKWMKSGNLAVLLTAFLFSASHLQFYGFLPRLVLGLGFGYIYLWSGNIWLPVLAHFINNLVPVILSYFMGWDNVSSTMDEFAAGDVLMAAIPAIIALLVLFSLRTKKREGV